MSVITALTSQNTTGVRGIHVVPADFVSQQIDDVITDIPPKCIKTGASQCSPGLTVGMLASADIIEVVANALGKYQITSVVDPVTLQQPGAN